MEFCDEYCHLSSSIYYTPESIPCAASDDPEGEQIHSDFTTQIEHCMCKRETCDANCTCVSTDDPPEETVKPPYAYDESELILSTEFTDRDQPIYECNSSCKCDNTCRHRLVQYGPRKSLRVCQIESKGLGLFTETVIPKGGFVCEYAGEIITKSLAAKRNCLNEANGDMNYIICVNEHFGCNKIQTFVDPSKFGNIGRYLNHSCEPNCVMVPVRVDNLVPKLCLFAANDIEAGVELTFSYGLETTESGDDRSDGKRCLCGSKHCSSWLPERSYDD